MVVSEKVSHAPRPINQTAGMMEASCPRLIVVKGGTEKELFGGEAGTTNNRMELTAAIRGLDALSKACEVDIYTDSQYVQKGMTEWVQNWKRRGWRTADKQAVKNVDLWQQLEAAAARHKVRWHWVRGHSGHPENERADALANRGVEQLSTGLTGAA